MRPRHAVQQEPAPDDVTAVLKVEEAVGGGRQIVEDYFGAIRFQDALDCVHHRLREGFRQETTAASRRWCSFTHETRGPLSTHRAWLNMTGRRALP